MRAVIVSQAYLDPAQRGKLRALTGLGASVVAAVPGGDAGDDAGVRLAPIPTRGDPAAPAGLRWSRRALRRLFTDFRPDIVQIEEEPPTRAAAAAARESARLGIPAIAFSWESLPPPLGFRERRRAGATLRHCAAVIGGTAHAAQRLADVVPGRPSLVLPQHGIAPPRPAARVTTGEALALGYVGRLLPERGVDLLLRAATTVMGAWSLTVAGTGPEQEPLEELAQKLGLASRIRWLGGIGRDEITALWPTLDALVVPSRLGPQWVDRWSPVLIDAMARQVVPVVMAGSPLASVVEDAGLVVEDEETLGLALQHLLAYPEKRHVLATAARRRILEEYVDDAVARRTLEFWQGVAAAHP